MFDGNCPRVVCLRLCLRVFTRVFPRKTFSHEEYFISLKRNITEIDCSISIQCALKFDASERRYHDLVFLSATNIFLAEYSTFLMIRWI